MAEIRVHGGSWVGGVERFREQSRRRRWNRAVPATSALAVLALEGVVRDGVKITGLELGAGALFVVGFYVAWPWWDRRPRRLRLPVGVLATANATCWSHDLCAFDRSQRLAAEEDVALYGDIEVAPQYVAWKPLPKSRQYGAHDIVLSWNDVAEMNCLSLRRWELHRLDACSFRLSDGREWLFSIDEPDRIEAAATAVGARVISNHPPRRRRT
ncbi:MAG TPA: hypothetical protein VFW71_03185 [Actinomycetota bacterium]|nr:hypothetical protein [Actinomycetota bacterium]